MLKSSKFAISAIDVVMIVFGQSLRTPGVDVCLIAQDVIIALVSQVEFDSVGFWDLLKSDSLTFVDSSGVRLFKSHI